MSLETSRWRRWLLAAILIILFSLGPKQFNAAVAALAAAGDGQ